MFVANIAALNAEIDCVWLHRTDIGIAGRGRLYMNALYRKDIFFEVEYSKQSL